jgi:hypothetical protein
VAYDEGRGCSRRDLDSKVGDIPWYPRDPECGEGNGVQSVMMSIPFLQLEGDFFSIDTFLPKTHVLSYAEPSGSLIFFPIRLHVF